MRQDPRRRPFALATALGLVLGACAAPRPATLAIRDVTVVDVVDGTLAPGRTVLVDGDRIVEIGASGEVAIAKRAEVVEGAGGFLVPGLWDAHVHSAASLDWHFPLFLAHGVTSVRNMHSTVDDALALVREIQSRLEAGTLAGPRFLANGAIVDGDPPSWPGSVVVRDAEEARAAVDRLADGGADFVKVYDRLTPEAYAAILERARERGIPVDGHVPASVRPRDAAAAGQRTIEHGIGMTLGCSSAADSLRAEYRGFLERLPQMPPYPDAVAGHFQWVRRAIDTRDAERCRETARTLRAHSVVSVPTLVITAASGPEALLADEAWTSLLPASVREGWRAMSAQTDPIAEALGSTAEPALDNVRLLHEAGVPILAGTDVGNPFLVPGRSLHRELARLTEAGLSPLDALRAATLSPARTFGLEDELGTVEAGKLADLVLLEANPLERIENAGRIAAVVRNGRLLRRADLDALLARAAAWTPE